MDQSNTATNVDGNLEVMAKVGDLIRSGFADRGNHPFADDFVFHFFNRQLPDLNGDHHGIDGIAHFFQRLGNLSDDGFRQEHHSLTPFGDELLVAFVTNTVGFGGTDIDVDAVVIWRILDGQVHEGWDIPAVNTVRPRGPAGAQANEPM